MSASVSGPEPRDGSPHASTRRLVGAFAIATMLLTALFAASPAWGQDAGGAQPPEVPVPGGAPAPPPAPADPAPPPRVPTSGTGTSAPAVPRPPAKPDSPPIQQHSGAGQAGIGDRISEDDLTRTTSPSTATRDRVKKAPLSAIARGNRGQNRSVDDSPSRSDRRGSAAKRTHAAGDVSRGRPPGFRNQLPSPNQSFSLHTGPGGAAAGLALAGMVAILGAVLMLPRDSSRIVRMPTATWRPLAYVPPIESPG